MSWQAPHTAVTVSFPGPSGNSCAKAGVVAAPSAAAMRDNAVFIEVSSPKNGPCVETKDGEVLVKPENSGRQGGRFHRARLCDGRRAGYLRGLALEWPIREQLRDCEILTNVRLWRLLQGTALTEMGAKQPG